MYEKYLLPASIQTHCKVAVRGVLLLQCRIIPAPALFDDGGGLEHYGVAGELLGREIWSLTV